MRFKKGTKVEVLQPSGAWRSGEIVSGNGRTYNVMYDYFTSAVDETTLVRVSRKAIRPCPPPVIRMHVWINEEMVEVFHEFSWKTAFIKKYVGKNYYLVRLHRSLKKIQIINYNMRACQSWQDGDWFVIRQSAWPKVSTRNCYPTSEAEARPRDYCLATPNNTDHHEPSVVPSRTLKRVLPSYPSDAESHTDNFQKLRAVEEDGACQRVKANDPFSLRKVDAVAYPREIRGETYMHTSYKTVRAKTREANVSDSDACSVGSCSVISDIKNNISSRVVGSPNQDADTLSADFESFHESEKEKCNLFENEGSVAEVIHGLEVHSYCSTLKALFASGPLSWEQELLLTNLRDYLNISNEEHLMELRKLMSKQTGISIFFS